MAKKVGSVSVRGGLLALLTMGPAYGFQLHGEFAARTAERRTVNVGQVYATLNRLVRAGAVAAAGVTDDGLPLYSLSDAGSDEAAEWLRSTTAPPGEEWAEMLDRVLLSLTLPQANSQALIVAYEAHWRALSDPSSADARPPVSGGAHSDLAAAAEPALAEAALVWLSQAATAPRSVREFSRIRPRRGRRPAALTAS